MTGLSILLDVDKFPLPEQNNMILDMFLSIKAEIVKSLSSLEGQIIVSGAILIVVLRPRRITFDYIIEDPKLRSEIIVLLAQKMDLEKVGDSLLRKDLN